MLYGTDDVNQMFGYGGDDELYGGFGGDALYGGRDDDYIDAKDGQMDYVHCGSGEDSYEADAIDYVAPSYEYPAPNTKTIRAGDYHDGVSSKQPWKEKLHEEDHLADVYGGGDGVGSRSPGPGAGGTHRPGHPGKRGFR